MDFTRKDNSWLLIRKDGLAQRVMPGMMFVGREECDIILQSASSDKRHAVIFFDTSNKEIHIKDLNSLTGTYVNGMKIPEQTYVKLKHADTLRFGYGPDIFHIQNYIGSSIVPPSHRLPEKHMSQSWSEKTDGYKERHSSPANNKMVPPSPNFVSSNEKNVIKRSNLHDSLEDLRRTSQGGVSDDSFHPDDSDSKSVSPAFSSLTFKRSNTRVLSTPSDLPSPSSAENSIKGDVKTGEVSDTENESFETCKQSPTADSSMSPSIANDSLQSGSKDESAEDSGPVTMAFTVAFDNPTPKKRFSIKDSISKYAPKKADADRASRQKQEKVAESPPVKKAVVPEPASNFHVQLRKKKSTGEKDSKDRIEGWKLNHHQDENVSEPKLSHGATYLIQKMFRGSKGNNECLNSVGDSKRTDIPVTSGDPASVVKLQTKPDKKEANEQAPDNEDNKSDTGTYTVDEELNNELVEARQKIDEVFGITEMSASKPVSPVVPCEKKVDVPVLKQDNCVNNWDEEKKEVIVPPLRTKRRLPVPPVQRSVEVASPLSSEKSFPSGYGTYNARSRPETICSSVPKDSVPKEEFPAFEKKSSIANERTSFSLPSNRVPLSNRLTLNNLELLQLSTNGRKACNFLNSGSEIPMRRTPPGSWRRTPWNLSGSDMDLDQIKLETSSVLSDVSASTEPPSTSLHQSIGRGDVGPQMKFNRAFALRRARLGLDTDLPPASRNVASRESKTPKDGSQHSTPSTSPLSRQDGGRFSLRLPKSSAKQVGNKTSTKTPVATKSPAGNAGQRFGHRRMDSDPSKTAFLRKGIEPKFAVAADSNKQKSNIGRPFQRAASFSNNEDSTTGATAEMQRSYEQRPERKSVAVLRSVPRILQSLPKEGEDDSQQHRESRASPRPLEKDLSALDNLVIQATHQLSAKLKTISYNLLVKERDKFTEDSSERLMIDEVLPRVSENASSTTCSACSDRGVSQDLANILKNLKRVEQSLEVLTIVVDEERMDPRRLQQHHHHHHHHHHPSETEDSIYVVDV